jgi:hypothetical protein
MNRLAMIFNAQNPYFSRVPEEYMPASFKIPLPADGQAVKSDIIGCQKVAAPATEFFITKAPT